MINKYTFFPNKPNPEEFEPHLSKLVGSFIDETTGEEVSFEETGHYAADKIVGANEYWEVRGDNGKTYFLNEDGTVTDDLDNQVGHFQVYAADEIGQPRMDYKCPECGSRQLEYDWANIPNPSSGNERLMCEMCGRTGELVEFEDEEPIHEDTYENAGGPTHWEPERLWEGKVADTVVDELKGRGRSFSTRGMTAGTKGAAEGVVVRPDRQSKEEILEIANNLPTHEDDARRQRELIPEWAINRGGSVKQADEFQRGPGGVGVTYAPSIIVVSKWITPDLNWILYHDNVAGMVAEAGGLTSHGVVVARERNIPIVVDATEAVEIEAGDHARIDGESGIVDVNGGSADIDRYAPGQQASMGVTRFVWSGGEVDARSIDPANPEANGHFEIMGSMPSFDSDNFWMGTIYEDGHADLLGDGEGQDEAITWLQSQGVEDIRVVGDMSALGAVEDDVPRTCDNCGSHSLRGRGEREGRGVVECLTCGNEFTYALVKTKTAAHMECPYCQADAGESRGMGERGNEAFYVCGSCGNLYSVDNEGNTDPMDDVELPLPDTAASHFLDSQRVTQVQKHSPGKKHLPYATPKRNRQYEHIFDSCRADGGSVEECKELAARTVNKQRKEKGETKSHKIATSIQELQEVYQGGLSDEMLSGAQTLLMAMIDGADFGEAQDQTGVTDHQITELTWRVLQAANNDPRTASGYLDQMHLRSGLKGERMAKIADLKPGEWYVMRSPKYKVPDVIQVLNVEDDRVEAAIQGDDKGLFPIVINEKEMAQMDYTFEPFTEAKEHPTVPVVAHQWRSARRNFKPAEQRELIDENLDGKARNINKMNLEGTHYNMWERKDSKDELSDSFLW